MIIFGIIFYFWSNASSDQTTSEVPVTSSPSPVSIQIIPGFGRPFCLNKDKNGLLYVCDFVGDHVAVFDQNLHQIKTIGSSGSSAGQLYMPHSVDFDLAGNIVINEYGNKRVQTFTLSGQPLSILSTLRPLAGPATAYFDHNFNLYVADFGSDSVLKFDPQGQYVGWIGARADGSVTPGWTVSGDSTQSKEPGGFNRPHAVLVDLDGTMYVIDSHGHRIERFNHSGQFTGWIGAKTDGTLTNGWEMSGYASQSSLPGGFNTPIALGFWGDDELVILEYGNPRMQRFTKAGQYLGWFGKTTQGKVTANWQIKGIPEQGDEPGAFNLAYDLKTFDHTIYVADTGNHRIQKIEFR